MNLRFFAAASLAAVIAIVSLAVVPVVAQAPTTPAKNAAAAKPLRTPWGDPDLQGTFTSDDLLGVPMQRPAEFGDRIFLTDEEFAKRDERDAQGRARNREAVGAFRGEVGSRTSRQTSLVVDPPDGKVPPMTAEAQKIAAEVRTVRSRRPESWEDRSLYDRCITRGVLGSVLPVIYGNGLQIVQGPGFVAINYEMIHDTRVIPLDSRPHAAQSVRQYLGDPRGRWEGDTLVIETTNFSGKTSGIGPNGGASSTSDALRLVERFRRVDADRIDYEVTIDDPKTYTKPWKMLLPLTTQPNYKIFVYECHEGNIGFRNILSSARAEERAIEEAAKNGTPPPPLSQWTDGGAGNVYVAPGTQTAGFGRGGGPGGRGGAPGGRGAPPAGEQ